MKKLNYTYRKKNRVTDVLAFSRPEGYQPDLPEKEIGDVVLCWPQCRLQAQSYGVTLRNEVTRLTVHGVLHLFGFDHEKSAKEAKRMFRWQDRIVKNVMTL